MAQEWEQVVAGLGPRLHRLAYLLVGDMTAATDVVAAAMVRCAPRLRRGSVSDPASHLVRAVVTTATSRRRWPTAASKRHTGRTGDGRRPDPVDHGPFSSLPLMAALAELPARQRAVLVLRCHDEFTDAQVADALDLPVAAVRTHATRGLAAMRTVLSEPQGRSRSAAALEEQLRQELRAAAAATLPPVGLVADVRRRLRRRARRRGALAAAAAGTCAAVVAVVSIGPTGGLQRHPPAPTPQPRPSPHTSTVLHAPVLVDTTNGHTLRSLRTVVLPGGRSPIRAAAYDDVLYADATYSDGTSIGNVQRLVRVDGSSGRVVMSATHMSTPTTPLLAYGRVWVADGDRLLGYDPRSLVLRSALRFPGDLSGQVAAAGGYVWVAGWTHLDRVDPRSGQVMSIAPRRRNERYAGIVASSTGGTLIAAIEQLPESSQPAGAVTRLDPVTGVALASRELRGLGTGELSGLAGGSVWLPIGHLEQVDRIAQVATGNLVVSTPFRAEDDLNVAVSNGVTWISAADLADNVGHAALFECVDPTTSDTLAQIALRSVPGRSTDGTPPGAGAPRFVAAGPSALFATIGHAVVIYPADPGCAA